MKPMRVVIYDSSGWDNIETIVNSKEDLLLLLSSMPDDYELVKVEPTYQAQSLADVLDIFSRVQENEKFTYRDGNKYKLEFGSIVAKEI